MEAEYGWDKEFRAAGFILFFILLSVAFAHAGGDTGLPGDDPKEIAIAPAPSEVSTTSCVSDMFMPMPGWARFNKMPPLPGVLRPMGKSPESAVKPSPAAVAETKPDGAPPPKPAPKPKAPEADPDLVALSPFMQWIRDHPKEAVAEAHRQAAAEVGAPASAPVGGPGAVVDPYWMPPMIEASGANPDSDTGSANGGSSAIYSRPQR